MMRLPARVLACVIFCAAAPYATAQAPDTETLTIYSDVCFHEETGDLLGDRLLLRQSNGRTFVELQAAEGVWLSPQTGQATIEGASIHFTVEGPPGPPLSFTGAISAEEISGRYTSERSNRFGGDDFRYRRQANISTPLPACQPVARESQL